MTFGRPVKQLTKEQALAIAQSGEWKNWSHEKRARRQICQKRLMMDFSAFHESVEKTLGRSVWVHEFASRNSEALYNEIMKGAPPPNMQEILNLIPSEKLIVVVIDDAEGESSDD